MHARKPHFALSPEFSLAFVVVLVTIELFQFQILKSCYALDKVVNCPPSSCGKIRDIKFPFRLQGDPESCGDPRYELACENNSSETTTLTLSLFSGKYHVESIHYNNYTIRLVDPAFQHQLQHSHFYSNCTSTPRYTLSDYNFSSAYGDPYSLYQFQSDYASANTVQITNAIIFWYCSQPVTNGLYANATLCSQSESDGRHSRKLVYVTMGHSDFQVGCQAKQATLTSWTTNQPQTRADLSYSNLRLALSFGFELSWLHVACKDHCGSRSCFFSNSEFICGPILEGETQCHYPYDSWIGSKCGFIPKYRTLIKAYLLGVINGLRSLLRLSPIYESPELPSGVLTGQFILPSYVAARLLLGIVLLTTLLTYRWRRRHLSVYENIETFLSHNNGLMPVRYSYREIKRMTSDFKDRLGEGGYGCVYKGKLRSGPLVAIKMLTKSKTNGQDFINEVATIGRIHHVNVVQLTGFCVEGSKRALVYEFMPNGSLDKHIFSKQGAKSNDLSCDAMYSISLGVARGIAYLHQGCDMQILHFDIKPHNILLDENFIPKVSDFGLARLYAIDDSIVSVTARGTLGYMAPELYYKNIGGVSYKADVYSFGMLLMEMASKRKNLDLLTDNVSGLSLSKVFFPTWIHDQFSVGKNLEIEHIASEEDKNLATKMIMVALWCIQMNPLERPSMSKVVEMLEGDLESIEMPQRPTLYPDGTPLASKSNQEESSDHSEDVTDNSWETTSTAIS